MAPKPKPIAPVPKEALKYFKKKKLKPSFSHQEVWREEHTNAFTIAKITNERILGDLQNIIERSISEGTTFVEFKRQAMPLLEQAGWVPHAKEFGGVASRLETIYDTNMRMARAAGQWQRIQRNKKAMPYGLYMLGPSANHRDEHVSWAGTILPIDDPWWQTHMPPNGYGCKCHIRAISKWEFQKRGGKIITPEDFGTEPFENKVTGKIFHVPVGIDPGFDYNPGAIVKKPGAKPKKKGAKRRPAESVPVRLIRLRQILLAILISEA